MAAAGPTSSRPPTSSTPAGEQIRVAVTLEQCWQRVPGGTATSILGLVRALAQRSDVDVVGVSARHDVAPPEAFRPAVPVRQLPLPALALYEAWHAVRRPQVERATGPVDVVHGTAIAVPPTARPLVMTVHDLAFLAEPGHATRHGNRFFRRGTELARRHARLVVVPSEATRAECLDAGFEPGRLRVVPWGVDVVAVDAEQVDEARAARGLDRPYVLFVGTIEPRKNLAAVIDAMARVAGRGVDLALVGPKGWNEDLDRKLWRLDASDVRVHRLGFVAPRDLPALYAGCAAFCYPSLREGFGMPVLEAMSQGAPVVTSRGTATEEVLGDAGLVVDPRDHEAIGAALVELLDDRERAATFGELARARATEFTWARTAQLTVDAYREAIG